MVLGYYFAYLVTILVAYYYMEVRFITGTKTLEKKDKKALFSISIVSMCNNGLAQLMYLLDVFVLGIVAADESILASYKVATIIPSALTFIPLSLMTYLYPYFAEHRLDGKWCIRNYVRILIMLGSFNIMLSFVLFLMAPLIIDILYGNIYLDAVPIFRILSVNYFFSGTFRILSGNLIVTQRKLKFNLIVAIVSGIINIVTDFLFIQWWGAIGAAYATVVVVIVSSVMSTIYLLYIFKQNL